jgi:glycosyltransferase involved in cell wall biosynthesis
MGEKSSINIVIPVFNEQAILSETVGRLCDFLGKNVFDDWQITIADNASTDNTLKIAQQLEKQHKNIKCIHLDQKGRGRALKKAWNESDADIMCYMDADLSTDLAAFPKMIDAIKNGAVVATGNRLHKTALVKRDLNRTILSKGYNAIAKMIVKTKIDDLQCGFKAIGKKAKQELLPHVQDNVWFFDSELLILAEKQGYPVAQIPVKWTESKRTSRVHIVNTVTNYIKNLLALRKRLKKQRIL